MRLLSFCSVFLRVRVAACLQQSQSSTDHHHPTTPSHHTHLLGGRAGGGAGGGGSWSAGLLAIDFDAVVSTVINNKHLTHTIATTPPHLTHTIANIRFELCTHPIINTYYR